MDYSPETRDVQESTTNPPDKLSPTGISAMQGDVSPVENKPVEAPPPVDPPTPVDVSQPPAVNPEPVAPANPEPVAPAAPEPHPEPVAPPAPAPADGEKGMVDRIEKKDIGERDYCPSGGGERGF